MNITCCATVHGALNVLWKTLRFANACRAQRTKMVQFLMAAFLLLALDGCAQQQTDRETNASILGGTPSANLPDVVCVSTDQDQYVYRPARLQPVKACMRATGTVVEK